MARKKRTEYLIQAVHVCDDVRREDTGKEILIGVYNRAIVVEAFPVKLAQLVVHLHIEMISQSAKEIRFRIVDETGKERAAGRHPISRIPLDQNLVFKFQVQNVTFAEQTDLDIQCSIDRVPETVVRLTVRAFSTEEERDRLKAPE